MSDIEQTIYGLLCLMFLIGVLWLFIDTEFFYKKRLKHEMREWLKNNPPPKKIPYEEFAKQVDIWMDFTKKLNDSISKTK